MISAIFNFLIISIFLLSCSFKEMEKGTEMKDNDIKKEHGDQDIVRSISVSSPQLPAPVNLNNWGECSPGWKSDTQSLPSGYKYLQYCYPEKTENPECSDKKGPSLQKIVDNTEDGSFIELEELNYAGPVFFKNRVLTISSKHDEPVTITSENNEKAVFHISGGEIDFENLSVCGGGTGIFSDSDSRILLSNVKIYHSVEAGIKAKDSSFIKFRNLKTVYSKGVEDGDGGKGIVLMDKASMKGQNLTVKQNRHGGVQICELDTDCTASLEVTDIAVTDTQPKNKNNTMGYGILTASGGSADIKKGLISGNHTFGIAVFASSDYGSEKKASVSLEKTIIRNTKAQKSDNLYGWGVYAEGESTIRMDECLVSDNTTTGILMAGASGEKKTEFHGKNLIISNTAYQPMDFLNGEGIVFFDKTKAELNYIHANSNRSFGIMISYHNSSEFPEVKAENITITETIPRKFDGSGGFGIGVFDGGKLEMDKFLIKNNFTAGIVADTSNSEHPVSTKFTDGTIENIKARYNDNEYGSGFVLQYNVISEADKIEIKNTTDTAVFIYGEKVFATFKNTLIDEIYETVDMSENRSNGVGVYAGAELKYMKMLIRNKNKGISMSESFVYALEECKEAHEKCAEISGSITGFNYWNLNENYDILDELRYIFFTNNGASTTSDTEEVPAPIEMSP
ncbi:MAG: right-handed parallel beta-helix repeat-containing protein [bacterium]